MAELLRPIEIDWKPDASEKAPKADAVMAVALALRPTASALKSFVKAPAPTEVAPKSEASDEPAAVE